jgi:hypothetical protein
VAIARVAGMLPSQVDRLPLGEWAYNAQIVEAARQEWRDAIEKAMPRSAGQRMGYELVEPLLLLLLKETG